MVSTYSTSLRIEEPATGDQAGTWGTTVNNNLGTLIEQAITGVLSIAMGDANVTLTALNGASDQSRNAVLILTGANTAIRTVITPSGASKVYIIVNNTTGGFAITLKNAAGATTTSIANGAIALCYTDGTNAYTAISASTFVTTAAVTAALQGVAITGNTTAVAGNTYLTDTTSGVFTLTLPASPTVGDRIQVVDSKLKWATNNLTVGRNSQSINGTAADLVCDISTTISYRLFFEFVGGAIGWSVSQ